MTPERFATDLHWAALHAHTLCVHDDEGRLIRWNGLPDDAVRVPTLLFARTRHGNLWRLRAGLPDPLVRELARLCGAERTQGIEAAPADPGEPLLEAPERWPTIEERILEHRAIDERWSGLAYRFPDVLPQSGEAELLADGALGELAEVFPGLAGSQRERAPCAVRRIEGSIVSACHAATRPGPDGAVEAGVETLPAHRGQGHAAAVVALFAREIARRGGVPLYSTAASNRASRALARKLGLIPYAGVFQLR